MKKALAFVVLMACLPAVAQAGGRALVVVAEAPGVPPESIPTARTLLANELRANGITVVDAEGLGEVRPVDESLRNVVKQTEATTVYALKLLPLGKKILVDVEVHDRSLAVVDERRLTASGVEELDLVIPRIVKALMTDKPVEETARIDTVTAKEGKKWEKKPGEFLWGLGLVTAFSNAAGVGADLRFAYEMENFQLNAALGGFGTVDDRHGGESFDGSRFGLGVNYLFSTEEISPYVGAGLAFMTLKNSHGSGKGMAATPCIGVEFFRLHSARLIAELGAYVPFFKVDSSYYDSSDKYLMGGWFTLVILW